jgi:hypothetical protein
MTAGRHTLHSYVSPYVLPWPPEATPSSQHDPPNRRR